MIEPPANTRVWIAAGVTDLRRGFTGLSALVQIQLEQSPFSGHLWALLITPFFDAADGKRDYQLAV